MVTWARRDTSVGDTTNATTYTSASFTPIVGDLLTICVDVTTSVLATPPLTASANGMTFTLLGSQLTNASANRKYIYIANQLVPASPVAMTVTITLTGDAGAGVGFIAMAAIGMLRVGLNAIRQYIGVDNSHTTAGTTPSVVFDEPVAAANPVLWFCANLTGTGASLTPPTSFTEYAELTYSTPTRGIEVCARDSGHTSDTITAGSTMTVGGVQALEFDASDPATTFSGWGVPI